MALLFAVAAMLTAGCLLLPSIVVHVEAQHTVTVTSKILTPEEFSNIVDGRVQNPDSETKLSAVSSRAVLPSDNGGNYGDLIYRGRENGDDLLWRETVILDALSSSELSVQWYASLNARRISTVRVLNIGRERAYCARIDVAAADVQALLRVPPLYDPRVLIEVYGF